MSVPRNPHRPLPSSHAARPAESPRRLVSEQPQLFPIGSVVSLLQGFGRHRFDDAGSRGFEVA